MNYKTQTITHDLSIPDGYRFVGYRPPVKGELFLGSIGIPCEATFDYTNPRHVFEKISEIPEVESGQVWRNADGALCEIEYVSRDGGYCIYERGLEPHPDRKWSVVSTTNQIKERYTYVS